MSDNGMKSETATPVVASTTAAVDSTTASQSAGEATEYVRALEKAVDAAFAFIDSHVADPDITEEMTRKHADYQEARYNLRTMPRSLPSSAAETKYVESWKHSCAGLLTDGVELWLKRCPHCGKPAPEAPRPTSGESK